MDRLTNLEDLVVSKINIINKPDTNEPYQEEDDDAMKYEDDEYNNYHDQKDRLKT